MDILLRSVIRSSLAAALFLWTCAHAQAPNDTIHELEAKRGQYAAGVSTGAMTILPDAALGAGRGLRPAWTTPSGTAIRIPQAGIRFDGAGEQSKFRLFEPGRLPLDIGWLSAWDRAHDRNEGYRFRYGPMLQKDFGTVQLNLNLLFERHVGEAPSQSTDMTYQWQAKYRWRQSLQFGLQGFGDMGEWDDWAPRHEQSHRFGPAIFGKLPFTSGQGFKYNAAYLADPSGRTRNHGFRLQLEYSY